MTVHVVEQGECMVSIARAHGFADYRAIYDHPSNADLKRRRPNPRVLLPGDEVTIPERATQAYDCATSASHEFRVKRPSRLLRLRLRDHAGEALGGAEYVVTTEGREPVRGKTDGDGVLEQKVPVDARECTIALPKWRVTWTVRVGALDPVDDGGVPVIRGVQARLSNLGYLGGDVDGEADERTRRAVAAFQRAELGRDDADGALDDSTLSALCDAHGC